MCWRRAWVAVDGRSQQGSQDCYRPWATETGGAEWYLTLAGSSSVHRPSPTRPTWCRPNTHPGLGFRETSAPVHCNSRNIFRAFYALFRRGRKRKRKSKRKEEQELEPSCCDGSGSLSTRIRSAHAFVAQRIEHSPSNRVVAGSIPAEGASLRVRTIRTPHMLQPLIALGRDRRTI